VPERLTNHRRLLREARIQSGNQQPPLPTPNRTGRNDPCPCGSGLKYKRCCINAQRSSI
jgi:uncharacterized protein YecA (UPF0149 family)